MAAQAVHVSHPLPDPLLGPPPPSPVPLAPAHAWLEPARWVVVGAGLMLCLVLLVVALLLAWRWRHRAIERVLVDGVYR
jgi:hypothetical protein